ncbi:MAG: PKD domain-containing protein [Saprospiraceae bacterium]|nr:PKD domain-containing protein [Saprospiraceae bacterium]
MRHQNFIIVAVLLTLLSSCSKPIANFVIRDAGKTAPAKVVFNNESKKADRFEWDFGDGKKSSDSLPTHEYRRSGNYFITLRAFKGKKVSETKRQISVEAPLECLVEIETEFGTMLAVLSSKTPLHRDNFINLAEEGYYDDLIFHRVISDFMIQGGDPNSRNAPAGTMLGTGGPDYKIKAEFVDTLFHTKGALAAARTNNPAKESSGSQFYIVQGKKWTAEQLDYFEGSKGVRYTPEARKAYIENGGTPHLDKEYTVFGHIIKGLDIIDKIAAVSKDGNDRPTQDIKMKIKVIK